MILYKKLSAQSHNNVQFYRQPIIQAGKTFNTEANMTEIDKTILPEPDKNQKVEVFVKRETEETYGELDLIRVFSNMGKKLHIYAWIIILFMLIGIAVPMIMVEMGKETKNISALISFRYPGAKDDKAPDGSPLNIRYISSSYILQKALSNTKLSKSITIGSIEQNLSVERLFNESTKQNLEVLQKVTETSKDSKDFSQVLNMNYKYDGKYVITLANGFGLGSNSKKKIYLSDNELATLLNNIITTYNEYFYTTYGFLKLPDNNLDSIRNSDLDYIERLDEIESLFKTLSSFCTDKNKGDYLTYRSKRTGLSFIDMNNCLKLIKDISVDYFYSFIFAENITKGDLSTITKYKYNLTNLERRYNSIISTITDNERLLSMYKNDNIAINSADEKTNTISSSVTDYYNTLIMNQTQLYQSKAELGEQIENLNYKISGFDSNKLLSTNHEYIKTGLQNLENICTIMYNLIREQSEEILESSSYKTFYMDYIGAQLVSNSIFTASNIKKVLIGMVAGLILAIFIWGMDGLIEEMKRSSPQEKDLQVAKR